MLRSKRLFFSFAGFLLAIMMAAFSPAADSQEYGYVESGDACRIVVKPRECTVGIYVCVMTIEDKTLIVYQHQSRIPSEACINTFKKLNP